MASSVVDTLPSNQSPPATDVGIAKAMLLTLPQELCNAIFRELFSNLVLKYENDGRRASLKPSASHNTQALAILHTCKQLYVQAKPMLHEHAVVLVDAAHHDLWRDRLLRGSRFWNFTRQFRCIHAQAVGADPVSQPGHLQSLTYWNDAYQVRDLLHMWPSTKVVTLGSLGIAPDFTPGISGFPDDLTLGAINSMVPQDLLFNIILTACHNSKFMFYSTVVHALRQHGIGQNVTFLIRFLIPARTRCEITGAFADGVVCYGLLDPETGRLEYHASMGIPDQQLPASTMETLVDPNLEPDAAPARPLPPDLRQWSFCQMWQGLRNTRV